MILRTMALIQFVEQMVLLIKISVLLREQTLKLIMKENVSDNVIVEMRLILLVVKTVIHIKTDALPSAMEIN